MKVLALIQTNEPDSLQEIEFEIADTAAEEEIEKRILSLAGLTPEDAYEMKWEFPKSRFR
ncbi:hypothetical protein ACQ4M3_39725 [Leptolyngbya sp. AN03gr2]|uniref:hypothetical protein n=1 Tax=unclassified Leptolyngbya TaxID=2650499 RepID=UPI003D31B45F